MFLKWGFCACLHTSLQERQYPVGIKTDMKTLKAVKEYKM